MKKKLIHKPKAVVVSAHVDTPYQNIGDVLSAKAIASLLKIRRIYFLPKDNGKSADKVVIYGGGGIIRYDFFNKVYQDFILRKSSVPYYIYGIGINKDVNTPGFTKRDIEALTAWLSQAVSVSVRDIYTYNLVKSYGINCRLVTCPTYTVLKNMKKPTVKRKFLIGFSPSFGHTKNYKIYKKDMLKIIQEGIKKYGEDNIAILCHDYNDYLNTKKYFSKKVYKVFLKDFKDISRNYVRCKNIITARGHGLIFAAAFGIPCSPIVLNKKFKTLYEYHYGQQVNKVSFSLPYHEKHLSKKQLPKNISTKFSI